MSCEDSSRFAQPGERIFARESSSSSPVSTRRLEEDRQALYDIAYGGRKRNKMHKLEKEIQTGDKEKLFHPVDSQGVEQVTQRGCEVPIFGGFKDGTGQISE